MPELTILGILAGMLFYSARMCVALEKDHGYKTAFVFCLYCVGGITMTGWGLYSVIM